MQRSERRHRGGDQLNQSPDVDYLFTLKMEYTMKCSNYSDHKLIASCRFTIMTITQLSLLACRNLQHVCANYCLPRMFRRERNTTMRLMFHRERNITRSVMFHDKRNITVSLGGWGRNTKMSSICGVPVSGRASSELFERRVVCLKICHYPPRD